jgi:hypothetical protein
LEQNKNVTLTICNLFLGKKGRMVPEVNDLKGNRHRLFIGHYRKTIPLSDSLPPDYPTLFSGLMVSGR